MTEKKTDGMDKLLTTLENAASTPVVPGELHAWCETAGNAFGALGEHWARKDDELLSLFGQIDDEDPALAPRVDRMREKQQKISLEFVRLEQIFARLSRADSEEPQASSELTQVGQTLRQDLLYLALRCRTLDKEATTWSIEATHRDRGTGD